MARESSNYECAAEIRDAIGEARDQLVSAQLDELTLVSAIMTAAWVVAKRMAPTEADVIGAVRIARTIIRYSMMSVTTLDAEERRLKGE